jgi:hypothetical protein
MKNRDFRIIVIATLLTVGRTSFLKAQNTTETLKNATNAATITKDPNDTTKMTWKTGGLVNLTLNQTALSNWSAGGDKSAFSLNSLLNLYAFYANGRNSWDNTLTLAYGLASTTSLGTRKTDDRINLTSKYGYDLGKKWYLSVLFDFRTQFAPGYNYPDANTRVLTSDFFAPAYFLLSLGMDYKPNDHFSIFLSPTTARELLVRNDSLSAVGAFGVDSGKKARFQFGAYASINYSTNLSKTNSYSGRLDLFSDYLHHPQDIAIYMTNVLNVKVSHVISINLSLTLIYDDNIKSVKSDGTAGGPTLQLQEVLGVGLAYKFAKKVREPPKPAS